MGDDSGDATSKHLGSGSVVQMYRPLPNPMPSRSFGPLLTTLLGFLLAALMAGACGSGSQDSTSTPVTTTASSSDPNDTAGGTGSTVAGDDSSNEEDLDPPNSLTPSSTPSVVATRFATLGGWDGTGWTTYGQPDNFTGPASVGDTFSIIQLDGSQTETTMESVGLVCDLEGTDAGSIGILTNPEIPSERGGTNPIAVRAGWNLQPHSPAIAGTATPVYFDAVREFFAARHVEIGAIEITQWFKLDLEGDGVDEVVLSARSQGLKPGQEAITYPAVSVVLLRRVVNEVAKTYFLSHSIFTEADGASLAEGETPDVRTFDVSAFADLNGDGRLEVIINDQGFESAGTTVWEFISNQVGPRMVLSGGCGS